MSRPSREQIDATLVVAREVIARNGGNLVMACYVALADDLKAARDGLDAVSPALEIGRALLKTHNALVAENAAMAALLGDGPHHDDDECDADFGATECRWHGIGEPRPHEPCWRHRRLAILAARAKRMGETGGFDGSLNCACGRKPSALHVHGGPAEELDAATKARGRR